MNERLRNPVWNAEVDRRWAAIRKAMADQEVDALVVQSNNDWLGGYTTNGYPKTMVFTPTTGWPSSI